MLIAPVMSNAPLPVPAHARAPQSGAAPAPARSSRPARRRWTANTVIAVASVGFGVTLALGLTAVTRGSLAAPGGIETAAGQIAGLTGSYLLLVMLLLISRLPLLEGVLGQDRLVRWHRRLGPWPIVLLGCHAVLITVGYAEQASVGPWHEFAILLRSYPDVLMATVAFGLLVMAGVASFRAARSRMAYETWWAVHLYTYLAIALAFSHQLADGVSFVGHPLARLFWVVVWASTAGVVLVYRVGLPLWRTAYHRLRVAEVRARGPGGRVGDLRRTPSRTAARLRRAVPAVALPARGSLVAGPPLLHIRVAATAFPPGDRQGARRLLRVARPRASRHARRHRGPLRRCHGPRPNRRQGPARRRRRRGHAHARHPRGPASRR